MQSSVQTTLIAASGGFETIVVPYIDVVDTNNDYVKAILTTNDAMGNDGYIFANTSEGIGIVNNRNKLNAFISHELGAASGYSKVSKIQLNKNANLVGKSGSVFGILRFDKEIDFEQTEDQDARKNKNTLRAEIGKSTF